MCQLPTAAGECEGMCQLPTAAETYLDGAVTVMEKLTANPKTSVKIFSMFFEPENSQSRCDRGWL
jgi:hypothetical protein